MTSVTAINRISIRDNLSYLILGKRGGDKKIRIMELLEKYPHNINQIATELDVNYRTALHHVEILMGYDLVGRSKPPLGKGYVYHSLLKNRGEREILSDIISTYRNSEEVVNFSDSPEFFRKVLEQTNDAVFVINEIEEIFFLNRSAEIMFGYESKREIGRKLRVFRDGSDNLLDLAKSGEQIRGLETKGKHLSGKLLDISVTVDPILDGKNKAVGYSILCRNITEKKELQKEREKIEKLNMVRSLAEGVGQELHNPLTSIKNSVYFLETSIKDPDADLSEILDILQTETTLIDDILRDLLDLARPEIFDPSRVDVVETLEKSISQISIPDGVRVHLKNNKKPVFVRSNQNKLRQVFSEIIQNSIEAMPRGGEIIITPKNRGDGLLRVDFEDTGLGIPEEDLYNIFDPIYTSKAKSVGLGLTLSKSIIGAHGGEIFAKSDPEIGTTMTITIPTTIKED